MKRHNLIFSLYKSKIFVNKLIKEYGESLSIIPVTENSMLIFAVRSYLDDYIQNSGRHALFVSTDEIVTILKQCESNEKIHYLLVSEKESNMLMQYLLFMLPRAGKQQVFNVTQYDAYNPRLAVDVHRVSYSRVINMAYFGINDSADFCRYKQLNFKINNQEFPVGKKQALIGTYSDMIKPTYPVFWKLLEKELESRGYEVTYVIKDKNSYYLSRDFIDINNKGKIKKNKKDLDGIIKKIKGASLFVGVASTLSILAHAFGKRCIVLIPPQCKRHSHVDKSVKISSLYADLNQPRNYYNLEMPWLRYHEDLDYEEDELEKRIDINSFFSERLLSYIDEYEI